MRFLIVDDSSNMRRVQRRTLETLGFTDIVEAEDGEEALELFRTTRPDVVVTDWDMPKMNGLALAKEIRQIDKDLPIIMVASESAREKVIEAIQAGITDYLIKPFMPDTFCAKIKKAVEGA